MRFYSFFWVYKVLNKFYKFLYNALNVSILIYIIEWMAFSSRSSQVR